MSRELDEALSRLARACEELGPTLKSYGASSDGVETRTRSEPSQNTFVGARSDGVEPEASRNAPQHTTVEGPGSAPVEARAAEPVLARDYRWKHRELHVAEDHEYIDLLQQRVSPNFTEEPSAGTASRGNSLRLRDSVSRDDTMDEVKPSSRLKSFAARMLRVFRS